MPEIFQKSGTEAEDNLQDGFILIFDKIHQFQFKGSFEGWAKRVVINNVLQKYRTEGIFEIVHENIPDIPTVEVDDETVSMEYLVSIIQQLPVSVPLGFQPLCRRRLLS